MIQSKEQYNRIYEIRKKIQNNKATKTEEKEYMDFLLKNDSLTQEQYNDYFKKDDFSQKVLNSAILLGGILLFAYLVANNNK